MHPSKFFITILSAIFMFAANARTEGADRAGVAVVGPDTVLRGSAMQIVDQQRHIDLAEVSSYDVYVGGVRLGKATVEVKRDGDLFILQGNARARSTINGLYSISYSGKAKLVSDPVQPTDAVIEEQKGSKTKTTFLRFPKPSLVSAVQVESRSGKKTKSNHKEFTSERFLLDPFSTIFFLRSHDWRVGEVQVFDILTGTKQYELQLTCRTTTVLALEDEFREAWEIVAQTRSVKPPRKIRMSGFIISLSRDSRREILKISGKSKIGKVVANLRTRGRKQGE